MIAGTKSSGKVLGANDKIRLGVSGIHGRGQSHMGAFASMDGVDVTYLIDPDSRLFESRSAKIKQVGGNTPKCVQDIREALDDKNLDAVSVATCNHWHALTTFWACQAEKDVYVEKPCSHNVFEGRQCVKAAEKYKQRCRFRDIHCKIPISLDPQPVGAREGTGLILLVEYAGHSKVR